MKGSSKDDLIVSFCKLEIGCGYCRIDQDERMNPKIMGVRRRMENGYQQEMSRYYP